jgi:hypothetical protein
MAEIKIKKKAPIWPWILGALVVGLLIYLLVFSDDKVDDVDDVVVDDTEEVVVRDTTAQELREYAGTTDIDEYNKFVADQNMDVSHEYSSMAMSKLIGATKAVAAKLGVDVSADLTKAESLANELTTDPESLKHANKIKEAGQQITQALKSIQSAKFPDLNSQYMEVETAVSNIKADTPTLDQKDNVRAFFSKAGNLLTSIQSNYGQAR